MAEPEESSFQLPSPLAPVLLLLAGLVLIVVSFLPLKEFLTPAWDASDSAQLAELRKRFHDSSYKSPERQGVTAEEADQMQANLVKEIERLDGKLSRAQGAPERWSRILFWSGAVFTAIGALWYRSA